MEGAAIQVRLCALAEPDPSGNERAELVLSGAPGQPPLPLARSASGGELSRVMLAARTVMADLDSLPTLVFDEIDAGIGGMAGAAVGRRLALLATCKQVLVVTHLPQIACFADRHVAVTKENGVAGIRVLEGDERIIEIARMLSGRSDSASAISHARELLDKAWETTRRLGAARPPSPPARAAATPVRGGARTT
jgi:DNA repair protein RecN (Recombination protein N)